MQQIVIQGQVTDPHMADIALDDLSLTPSCMFASSPSLPVGQRPPSPHCDPASQFTCVTGPAQCVLTSQVCDFVSQCQDGSDEANCGMLMEKKTHP